MEPMLDDRPAPTRPRASHRARRGRLPLTSRLTLSIGFTAALLAAGIAIGTGAVKTPLSDSATAQAPKAATLNTPSGSSLSYAVASVPASRASHSPSAKPSPSHTPSHSPSAKPSPSHSATTKPTPSPSHSATTKPTPQASHTPTATPSARPTTGSLAPTATAEYQTPTGDNQKAWSEAILNALGAPLTSANIISMGYWMQNEAGSPPYGIVGANNPINVSEPGYGGVPIQSDGDGVTYLMSYPTVQDGIAAIAAYLERGNYVDIVAALKEGVGLSGSNLASEIGLYSGDGYTTIPDSFGASQGEPEG